MGMYEKLNKLDEVFTNPADVPKLERSNETVTRESTQSRTQSSDKSRENIREKSRGFPTRDEIQEFSFSLRDELKSKVQAEVPHKWHKELEELTRKLNVKKLELYRYILGEFLGKVERKKS